MILYIRNAQKRQTHTHKVSDCQGRRERLGVTANGYRVSLRGDGNVLETDT